MRRAPIVLTATVAGTAAVLSFKPHEPSLPAATAASATPAPATGSSSSGSGTGSSGSSGSGGSSSGTKVVTGDAISTRYGNAQVRVTISRGRITKIEALQLQANEPKSVQISSTAEPVLRQEALTKQSAAIDVVSGATVTSDSYKASLQSALDKAGFKAANGQRASTTVPQIPEGDHGDGDRRDWDGGGGRDWGGGGGPDWGGGTGVPPYGP